MRFLALILVAVFSLVSVACGPKLQPPLQGEWRSFHNDKNKVSKDAREQAGKPAAER